MAPRIWHGMALGGWGQLIAQNNFDIHRWPMAAVASVCCAGNSFGGWLQDQMLGKKIEAKELVADPVFILGHWRTGTTFLHELFSLDERFATPTTFQCFAPHHHLLTSKILPKIIRMPSRRPMDNIEIGWRAPQEDEFALCTLGLPTTYRRIAFPNRPARHFDYLNMQGIPPRELERWKSGLLRFVKGLNYATDKPLVLKSPPHTGRIKTLLEMFPKARFVHLSRDPFEFIPSTLHLWRALDHSNGLQRPNNESRLEEFVFECFRRMYRGYENDRSLLPADRLVEIRYEDLTTSTVETMKNVYSQMSLGEFEPVEDSMQQFLSSRKGYKKNQHQLSDALRDRITAECANYIRQYRSSADSDVAAA